MISRRNLGKKKILIGSLIIVLIVIFLFFNESQTDNEFDSIKCNDCNLVIISATNLRYDHLGINDYFRNTSPNIDKFAKESINFHNAFSQASWTLPAGISLFTSLYPFEHGLMNRYDGKRLSDKTRSLVDILKKQGYKTIAFTGGFDYETYYGLISRFDTKYVYSIPINNETDHPINITRILPNLYGSFDINLDSAISWLKINKDEKFFMFLQGFDVHCPFTPPKPYDMVFDPDYDGTIDYSACLWTFERTNPIIENNKTYYEVKVASGERNVFNKTARLGSEDIKHLIALYDGEILYVDFQIDKILDELRTLGLLDKTIIILLSEHGDMFGKYGRFMRGGPLSGTFYDDVIHIPLIIYNPKIKPMNVNGLVQLIDVTPTILDFLGIRKYQGIKGKSIVPLIIQNQTINDFVYAGSIYEPRHTNPFFNKTSKIEVIRSKKWKLIKETIFKDEYNFKTIYELYDIVNDPEELNNIFAENENIAKQLEARLNDKFR